VDEKFFAPLFYKKAGRRRQKVLIEEKFACPLNLYSLFAGQVEKTPDNW
jgi:hypothetical protein